MAFMYTEGTADYLAATPALITTFQASGSIIPGRFVTFNSATDQRVHIPISTYQGSSAIATEVPAGLALATCADAQEVPVLVWGYAKNIAVTAAQTYITGYGVISGGGYLWNSGSAPYTRTGYTVAKIISGSATSCTAFINCM